MPLSNLGAGEFFPLETHEQHELGWVLGAVAVAAHDDREALVAHMPRHALA
jgi:hypothetical protein